MKQFDTNLTDGYAQNVNNILVLKIATTGITFLRISTAEKNLAG